MPRSKKPVLRFFIKLTLAQRRLIAEVAPALADRLKLDEPNQRVIDFTVAELKEFQETAETAIQRAGTGFERRTLRLILKATDQAITHSHRPPVADAVYQFKITLLESHPPIWRRIQVQDCTLDKLHEHVQTAMGWTNSHLHHFEVGEQLYGDPELMQENFEELEYKDSTTTNISDILPKAGKRFWFQYEYDFGDSWYHEILFEGVVRAEPKVKYPRCVKGSRACPPEGVGGVWGYQEFLEAMADPSHERHEELREWIGGYFDPAAFDPAATTSEMHTGIPDWRRMT